MVVAHRFNEPICNKWKYDKTHVFQLIMTIIARRFDEPIYNKWKYEKLHDILIAQYVVRVIVALICLIIALSDPLLTTCGEGIQVRRYLSNNFKCMLLMMSIVSMGIIHKILQKDIAAPMNGMYCRLVCNRLWFIDWKRRDHSLYPNRCYGGFKSRVKTRFGLF